MFVLANFVELLEPFEISVVVKLLSHMELENVRSISVWVVCNLRGLMDQLCPYNKIEYSMNSSICIDQ